MESSLSAKIIMSAMLERVRVALKSDSMASLEREYNLLQKILRFKNKYKSVDLVEKVQNGSLRRNVLAEHFIPVSFKQGNEDCIALR